MHAPTHARTYARTRAHMHHSLVTTAVSADTLKSVSTHNLLGINPAHKRVTLQSIRVVAPELWAGNVAA